MHERSVVRVPADVPQATLAPFGCGIQTGVGAVLNVLRPRPGSTIAVFGGGHHDQAGAGLRERLSRGRGR